MTTSAQRTRPRIDPRILDRRVRVARAQGKRRLRVVGVLLLVVFLSASAFALLHTSVFSARHVAVVGDPHTPRATILSVSGLGADPPLIDVNRGEVSARLERLPWVSRAVVSVHWPDSVKVVVNERVPVATTNLGGRDALVDASGRVLQYVPRPPPETVALALGRPRTGPAPRPGSLLGAGATPGLEVAAKLPVALAGRVQVVEVAPSGSVTLDLGGGLKALLGPPGFLEAKFDALASVLEGAHLTGPALIDLTVPSQPSVEPQPA